MWWLLIPVLAVASFGCTAGGASGEFVDRSSEQVFRVESSGGGWERAAFETARSPRVALYGDGRVVFVEPQRTLGTGPPSYSVVHVDPEAVSAFVDEVAESGLIGPDTDVGRPGVTDQSTTTIRLGDGDAAAKLDLYAFDPRFESSLDDPARERRRAVRDLLDRAWSFTDGDPVPWVPDRVTVYDLVHSGRVPDPTPTWTGPDPDRFLVPTDDGMISGELEGSEAAAVYAAALDNPTAIWQTQNGIRMLLVDPVP